MKKPAAPLIGPDVARYLAGGPLRNKRWKAAAAAVGYEPRKVHRPDLATVRRLTNEIAELPTTRRLTVEQFRVYARTIERLYRRQRRLETLVASTLARMRQVRYRERLTEKLVNEYNLDRELEWLLSRKGKGGKNVHAVSLGQLSKIRCGRTSRDYAEMGRRGAAVRWGKRKDDEEHVEAIGQGASSTAPGEVPGDSAGDRQVDSAPDTGFEQGAILVQ